MGGISAIAVVALVALFAGLASSLTNGAWQRDCENMGYSRVGDKVYTCSLKK